MIFFLVHYLLIVPPPPSPQPLIGIFLGEAIFLWLPFMWLSFFQAFCYWKGEFVVIGLWALIFRFSVIRKQALVHLLGIKQTQKLTMMANLSHSDFSHSDTFCSTT